MFTLTVPVEIWHFPQYVVFSMLTLGGAAVNRFVFFCSCFSAVAGSFLSFICRYCLGRQSSWGKHCSYSWGAMIHLSAVLKLVIIAGIIIQLPLWCTCPYKICEYHSSETVQIQAWSSNYKHQHIGEALKGILRGDGVHPLHAGARMAGGLPNLFLNTSVGFMGISQMLLCVFSYASPTWDLCLSKDERWSTRGLGVPVSQARNGHICQWVVEQRSLLAPAFLWGSSVSSQVLEERWETRGAARMSCSAALLWESPGFPPNTPGTGHTHWLSPHRALTDARSIKAGIAGDPGVISNKVLLLWRRCIPAWEAGNAVMRSCLSVPTLTGSALHPRTVTASVSGRK